MTKIYIASQYYTKFIRGLDNSLGYSNKEGYALIPYRDFIEFANLYEADISAYTDNYVFFRMIPQLKSYIEDLSEFELRLAEIQLSKRKMNLVHFNKTRLIYGAVRLDDLDTKMFDESIDSKDAMVFD